MSDWIGVTAAAKILGTHRTTVYRSLEDPQTRDKWWGKQGEGWRIKPASRRKMYQVSQARAEKLATETTAGEPEKD